MFYNFLTETASPNAPKSNYSFFIIIAIMFVAMYFFSMRPQKKKQQEEQKMRDNLQVGDEITTIGGICGRVVSVKEDSIIIETGADRNKMKITRWAVQANNTAQEKLEAERAAAKEAAEKQKAEGGAPTKRRFGRKKEDADIIAPEEFRNKTEE